MLSGEIKNGFICSSQTSQISNSPHVVSILIAWLVLLSSCSVLTSLHPTTTSADTFKHASLSVCSFKFHKFLLGMWHCYIGRGQQLPKQLPGCLLGHLMRTACKLQAPQHQTLGRKIPHLQPFSWMPYVRALCTSLAGPAACPNYTGRLYYIWSFVL